jgi:hypothetical protein
MNKGNMKVIYVRCNQFFSDMASLKLATYLFYVMFKYVQSVILSFCFQ